MPDSLEPQNLSHLRNDQRDDTRFLCEGNVEFRIEGSEVRTFAKLVDISFGGCYVEMTATSMPGTKLNLVIELRGNRFNVKGVVRTAYPCLGMGIEFTEASLDDRAALSEILLRLSQESQATIADQMRQGALVLPYGLNSQAVLEQIEKFFQNKNSLTRDEFLGLVARTTSRR